MGRIHILDPVTARLIAAGEVIDRPASALRELLDNALDSGAKEISVRVEAGGIASLAVSDNGCGMSGEDLPLSVTAHATSKIRDADDLLRARTLGFRGEALASIASAARIEILTREDGSGHGWRLAAGPGLEAVVEPAAARVGTTVTVTGLFERYPARKQFLKRPQSEAALCRQVFAERAIAHPDVAFHWISAGSHETYRQGSAEERLCMFYPEIARRFLHRASVDGEGFSGLVLYADPGFSRRDRRLVQVFVNRRRVPEWGLSNAVEYAYAPYMPGGAHPCAFLFAEVDPSLADFNIHPAKREVRLKNLERMKSAIHSGLRAELDALAEACAAGAGAHVFAAGAGLPGTAPFPDFGMQAGPSPAARPGQGYDYFRVSPAGSAGEPAAGGPYGSGGSHGPGFRDAGRIHPHGLSGFAPYAETGTVPERVSGGVRDREPGAGPARGREQEQGNGLARGPRFRFLGQAFGPYLVFEMDGTLFVLDQHAAHERILFDALQARESPSQSLLVPMVVDAPRDAGPGEEALLPELERAGFGVRSEGGSWVVEAVPSMLGGKAAEALAEILSGSNDGTPLRDRVDATLACRAAVKDGDPLDPAAACELFAMALELPVQRCPHGRPIWVRLDRDRLDRMVGRVAGRPAP